MKSSNVYFAHYRSEHLIAACISNLQASVGCTVVRKLRITPEVARSNQTEVYLIKMYFVLLCFSLRKSQPNHLVQSHRRGIDCNATFYICNFYIYFLSNRIDRFTSKNNSLAGIFAHIIFTRCLKNNLLT